MKAANQTRKNEIEAKAVAYIDKVMKHNVSKGMPPATPEERSRAIRAATQSALRIVVNE